MTQSLAEQKQAEADHLERRHRPSLETLGIYYHSNVVFGEYDRYHAECDGVLEVVQVYGYQEEEGRAYDFAFVELHCTKPGCMYPDFALPNPLRRDRAYQGPPQRTRKDF